MKDDRLYAGVPATQALSLDSPARVRGQARGDVLGCCLVSNRGRLIAAPRAEESLARGIGRARRACARGINFRENWRGCLRQGRFFSCPLGEAHAAD